MVTAILTKPLDGMPEGSERELDQADFDRLAAMGAVKLAGAAPEVKAAPPVVNKMAPPVANKAIGGDIVRKPAG